MESIRRWEESGPKIIVREKEELKMVEYNEPELKEKLLRVYKKFVENPSDAKNIGAIRKLDGEYESLVSANDYIASQPISKSMQQAIGHLSNLWLNSFRISKKDLLNEAKKILEDLKKF